MDVYTNVDTEAQKKLWDIYNTDEYVNYPDDEMQYTTVDVNTGKVIAQLGSRHQSSNVSFGTNQAVETNRDWGSTMKPITDYAPALEHENIPLQQLLQQMRHTTSLIHQRLSTTGTVLYGSMSITYAINNLVTCLR
ncbi:MAG: hypothetical protein ACLUAO_00520 [Streptococcus sp.]